MSCCYTTTYLFCCIHFQQKKGKLIFGQSYYSKQSKWDALRCAPAAPVLYSSFIHVKYPSTRQDKAKYNKRHTSIPSPTTTAKPPCHHVIPAHFLLPQTFISSIKKTKPCYNTTQFLQLSFSFLLLQVLLLLFVGIIFMNPGIALHFTQYKRQNSPDFLLFCCTLTEKYVLQFCRMYLSIIICILIVSRMLNVLYAFILFCQ